MFLLFAEKWKTHHRLHTSLPTIQVSQQYQAVQAMESTQLVYQLINTEDDKETSDESKFPARFQRYAASQICNLAYGKHMPRGDEREVRELEDVMNGILQENHLGEEVVPVLELFSGVMEWVPGFRAKSASPSLAEQQTVIFQRNMHHALTTASTSSWNWCKEAVAATTNTTSLTPPSSSADGMEVSRGREEEGGGEGDVEGGSA
ncbi:uncharacterized protein BP01DRAFT_16231 [Aspergillus saccharolyticus JOP 1030-1]|uniref:Uncharacterized protein n=1 Tax=Aspergillus saccharolyticus JOP 1030-1 TaxID=1450539 RepID=A0A318ZG08_9EURO|nr:hypothetical protein BP01DRAFT_16231 [Aspergillus saccharolyticus JOP 1030-1]PYH46486.1 hypothetical protein BP01DRAFT_16231 [Aspergillus saccharolyticus JOP 1030-1]